MLCSLDLVAMRCLCCCQTILELLLLLLDHAAALLFLLLRGDYADAIHEIRDVILYGSLHLLEHIECLDLVLDERLQLTIRLQVDTFTQHVHAV